MNAAARGAEGKRNAAADVPIKEHKSERDCDALFNLVPPDFFSYFLSEPWRSVCVWNEHGGLQFFFFRFNEIGGSVYMFTRADFSS